MGIFRLVLLIKFQKSYYLIFFLALHFVSLRFIHYDIHHILHLSSFACLQQLV